MAAGATAWALAIPVVQIAGRGITPATMGAGRGGEILSGAKILALLVGMGVAYSTTPLLSALMGWKTPSEKVRGIALALGTAQVLDGLVHMLYPSFYDRNPNVGLACAGNIFYGAGLLGIFSAYQ
ncbi:hypothetical protein ACA910_005359 [Epithemia clementina (nom. ined.)]